MPNFSFKVQINESPSFKLSQRKMQLIEALALGFSNKSIAEELGISIKSVERILSELNKKFNTNSYFSKEPDLAFRTVFNPRLRLIASLLANDVIDFICPNKPVLVSNMSKNLKRTLLLSCVGFSNKKIADLFGITEKAVELRFTQLFDYFNVDTRSLEVENPRVSLFISAYCRDNIKEHQVKRLYRETQSERIVEAFSDKAAFLDSLEEDYQFIG